MNKLLLVPLLAMLIGGGLVAYGVVNYSVVYTVTVHDTTPPPAPNIQLVTPAEVAVNLNEGEVATSTITLQNTGNADGAVTLSTSGQLPAHFTDGVMTLQVTVPAGQTVDVALYIPAPGNVDADTIYTVTVQVS